jgi:endoglucanase
VPDPTDGAAADDGGAPDGTGDARDAPGADVVISPLPSLHVVGNRIYDNDTPVQFTGVHRAGTEYSCVHGTGIFDGPSDTASIQGIKTWTRANAVRVPLNEDCWLGINGVPAQYAGGNYQTAIAGYVTLLLENGLYPILDLHWSAGGGQLATAQAAMPDQDHSVTFWSQVAAAFKGNLGVAFDLFNEPDPGGGQETADAWRCWRDGTSAAGDGGSCSGIGYNAAGMQTLLSAVRSAGANNLVLLAGVVAANAVSQWTVYKPDDPANNVAVSWHVFADRPCSSTSCFDAKVAPVAQLYPVVATQLGESDCQGTFITTAMGWLDGQQQGYVAFTWDTWSGNCESLISDYTGTPTTPYGQTYKTHLQGPADGGGD